MTAISRLTLIDYKCFFAYIRDGVSWVVPKRLFKCVIKDLPSFSIIIIAFFNNKVRSNIQHKF